MIKLEKPKIYIYGNGYMNPLEEYELIVWIWEQNLKGKNKSVITRFWMDIKENHKKYLLHIQAYELMNYIESKVTVSQEKRRNAYRKKVKLQAELEEKNWKLRRDKQEMMNILLKMVNPN